MRLEVFPGFDAHVHLVLGLDVPILIDAGSGLGNCTADLAERFAMVQMEYGEKVALKDVGRVLVTHGHMDHFGGVQYVVEQSGAAVGIHVLDKRVLTNYEERVLIASKSLREYLVRAGVAGKDASEMMDLYMIGKGFYRSVAVEFLLDESVELFGCMRFVHSPGIVAARFAFSWMIFCLLRIMCSRVLRPTSRLRASRAMWAWATTWSLCAKFATCPACA